MGLLMGGVSATIAVDSNWPHFNLKASYSRPSSVALQQNKVRVTEQIDSSSATMDSCLQFVADCPEMDRLPAVPDVQQEIKPVSAPAINDPQLPSQAARASTAAKMQRPCNTDWSHRSCDRNGNINWLCTHNEREVHNRGKSGVGMFTAGSFDSDVFAKAN